MDMTRRINKMTALLASVLALAGLGFSVLTGCAMLEQAVVHPGVSASDVQMVRVNEIMTSNSYFAALPDGSCYDWVELYNPMSESVDLKGFAFSDSTDSPRKWIVPESVVIGPGEYLVMYMSGLDCVDEQGNLHTSFKLSSKGEALLFSTSYGQLVQTVEIPECTMENISYGIDERTGSEEFLWMAEPSPGRECTGDTAAIAGELEFRSNGIVISEYMTDNSFVIYDRDGEHSDWLELYNPTEEEVALGGCSLSDKGVDGSRWYFPDDTVIGAGEYLLVFCSGKLTGDDGELHASFSLGSSDSSLVFFSPSGKPMLTMDITALPENVSCGLDSESGEWKLYSQATPGKENDTYSYPMDSLIQGTPASDVVISEALAVSSAMKGDRLTYDFVELYNVSEKEVNLSGYGLSDNEDTVKFRFPEVTLSPGGYLVVRCTGKDNTESYNGKAALTAAFKLNQGGEAIYLFYPDGHLADIMETGKQIYGVTRGRLMEDMSRLHYFGTATPGKANPADAAVDGYAPHPELSINGGYVEKGTVVTLTVPDGCTVRYTTDGRKPTEKSAQYDPDKGITVSASRSISAAAFKDGCMVSRTVTATFLVEDSHELPVVCMSSDPDGLFSDETGIYSSATGHLAGKKPNYQSKEERECVIEYYVEGKRALTFNAGARIFGIGSRTYSQKSFALIMREKYGANSITFPFFEDNPVTTFSALVLRQAGQECRRSKLRDELASAIAKNHVSCDIMDQTPVVLYINGEYWGIYYIREKQNEDFLVSHYGYEKGKIDIIKSEYSAQAGTDTAYRALREFADSHDLSKTENYLKMCEQINMESLMDFWICQTFFANNDTSNIRAYRSKDEGGKWSWMLFDLDNAFYPYLLRYNAIEEHMFDREGHGMYDECTNVIIRRLLKNKQFRQEFVSRYCHHLKTTFAPERTTALLDEMAAAIKPEIERQCDRWGWPTMSAWQGHVNNIRGFLAERHKYVIKHLKSEFNLSDKEFKAIYDAA